MQWAVTTPPTGTVCTWEQLKAHLHAPVSQQSLVMDYLSSATAYAETMLESSILPQTITATFDRCDVSHRDQFYADYFTGTRCELSLPRGPVISVVSLSDNNGDPISYSQSRVGNSDRLTIHDAQAVAYPLTATYRAGFAIVPADIVNAIRVHTATLYMVREDITNLAANPVHKIDEFYRYRSRGTSVA